MSTIHRRALCAALAVGPACYASHTADGVAGADAGPSLDLTEQPECPGFTGTDVSTCGAAGTESCGCVGDLRRCDTCDDPCPDGSICWMPQGVCKARDLAPEDAAPFDDICELRTDDVIDERIGLLVGPGGRNCASGRPCVVDATQAGTLEDPYLGVCLTAAYCRDLASDAELARSVLCLDSSGRAWDGSAPIEPCPTEPVDGSWCGPVTGGDLCDHERAIGAHSSCVGVDPTRGAGVCAPADDRCMAGSAEENLWLSEQSLRMCMVVTRMDDCVCMRIRGDDFSERFPSAVRRTTCEAYARRYAGQIDCLTAAELHAL